MQIRPNVLLGLSWVQTVCAISRQQKMSLAGKEIMETGSLYIIFVLLNYIVGWSMVHCKHVIRIQRIGCLLKVTILTMDLIHVPVNFN